MRESATVGVYLHVPFCERICPYCDFAVVKASRAGVLAPDVEDRYVRALIRELELRRRDFAGCALRTIYLGGGTPSLLRPASLARILASVRSAFEAAQEVEVTLEVNPSTLERERLRAFHAEGVNRLSVGIQSFDDDVLRKLGRAHRAEEGRRTLAAARDAGYDNVSLDLMFAAPGQTLALLERDLEEVLAFAPEHVSTYELTIEAGTPFATAAERGQLARSPEADVIAMIDRIESTLGGAGLARYELSSYARQGRESVHNRRYWERSPVLGLGMGAWSNERRTASAPHGERRANPRALPEYLSRVEAGRGAHEEREILAPPTARGEAVFLGLRRLSGLRAGAFEAEFGAPPRAFFADAISALVSRGLLAESETGDLELTPRGRLLADSVAERFV